MAADLFLPDFLLPMPNNLLCYLICEPLMCCWRQCCFRGLSDVALLVRSGHQGTFMMCPSRYKCTLYALCWGLPCLRRVFRWELLIRQDEEGIFLRCPVKIQLYRTHIIPYIVL